MFDRLNTTLEIGQWIPTHTQIKFGVNVNGEFKGIHYLFAESDDFVKVLDLIPEHARHQFCISVMEINTMIPPHTDSGIKAAINVYLQTEDCVTQFYDIASETANTYQLTTQTNGVIYEEADLVKSASFIAKPGEIWVLDVTKPHSVKPQGDIKKRVAVTLATDAYDFDQVCDLLKERGVL